MDDQLKPTVWRRFIQVCNDLSDFAKLGALLLAVGGFVALYFPDARRELELWVAGTNSYYNIGLLVGAPDFAGFRPRNLYSPLWNPRLGSLDRLMPLRESVVFNEKDEPAVGRMEATETAVVRTLAPKGTCLYVKDVYFKPYRRKRHKEYDEGLRVPVASDKAAVWAQSLSDIEASAKKAGTTPAKLLLGSLPPDFRTTCAADPEQGPFLCPRISVWVEARKVTC